MLHAAPSPCTCTVTGAAQDPLSLAQCAAKLWVLRQRITSHHLTQPSPMQVWYFRVRPVLFFLSKNQNRIVCIITQVLAGALQDNKRALIAGERTFGKGLIQTVVALSDGTDLLYTCRLTCVLSGQACCQDRELVS